MSRRAEGFEATIVVDDGSTITAIRQQSLWALSWNGRRWEGRSLIALVGELPGPGLGPTPDVLGQVLDALIAEIDRPVVVARYLQSQLGLHY